MKYRINKVLVCLTVVICIFSTQIFSQNQKNASYTSDIQRILDRGELVVAMYAKDTYPLFYTASDGTLKGFDVDLAKRIAAELGVKLRFDRSPETFDAVLELVNQGKADMGISLISITPARALRCRFSSPYLVLHPILVENRITPQNKDKPVFVVKSGTSYKDIAHILYPNAQIIERKEWDEAFQSVIDGEAQFSLRDEIGTNNYMKDKLRLALRLKFTELSDIPDKIGIVLPFESEQLERWLNVVLDLSGYPKNGQYVIDTYGE